MDKATSTKRLACTAFDRVRQIHSGSYVHVALGVRDHMWRHASATVLIFDDRTGTQIDFDLRGSDEDIAARILKQFPHEEDKSPRSPGRPRIGVVPREVTLLPRHWEWLAEQPGGASVTLRKLVEEARRAGVTDKAQNCKLQERAYKFMSAIAGDLPDFEEASRALFANDDARLKELIAPWPVDIRNHILKLGSENAEQNS